VHGKIAQGNALGRKGSCPALHLRCGSRRLGELVPHITFIELDFIDREELPELVLERKACVAALLIPNVIDELVALRKADGKGTVAFLPICTFRDFV
jgi:hypothetical protein